MSRHTFALYYANAVTFKNSVGSSVSFDDKVLYHRMVHILRFSPGDYCIFFDAQYRYTVRIESVHKKHVELFIESVKKNVSLSPEVTLLLPLLKKQALAEAVYVAVEMGVNAIQLVMTEKAQRKWDGPRELERLQAVVIAACEQAKYFAVPEIRAPLNLHQTLLAVPQESTRIYYDPEGMLMRDVALSSTNSIVVMVGPEGDLTTEEKVLLKKNNFNFVRLTPTVLRSVEAVTLGVGFIRSM